MKVEYSGTKLEALRGNMKIEYPEKTQIVRIFTSSTFTGLLNVVIFYVTLNLNDNYCKNLV